MKDYYQILNISHDADIGEIKKAFRRLAFEYHPDRNPENTKVAEEKFKEINEAYEVLGNDEMRWRYDRLSEVATMRSGVDNFDTSDDWSGILRRFAAMGFVMNGVGWGRRGCGRRGGRCRRQWGQ